MPHKKLIHPTDIKIYTALKVHCIYSSNILEMNELSKKYSVIVPFNTIFHFCLFNGVEFRCVLACLPYYVYVYKCFALFSANIHFKIKFKMSLKATLDEGMNENRSRRDDTNGSKYTLSSNPNVYMHDKGTHIHTRAQQPDT